MTNNQTKTAGTAPPSEWWGYCPFCAKTGMQTLGVDRECGRCGFRFRVSGWTDE